MRKKVRKSLAFLLALALVVSVMSGLGLSVSADDAQNEPVVTETEGEPAEEKLKAEESTPKEGEEEEEADPDAEAVPEEKKDVKQTTEGEGSGEKAAENKAAETPKAGENVQTATIGTGDKTVTVKTTAAAGVLPEGAKLVVKKLANQDQAYQDAESTLKDSQVTYDDFLALDVGFEVNGKEVEPEAGSVQVQFELGAGLLPEDADPDSLAVMHLTDGKVEDATNDVAVSGDTVKAELKVDSFSTFTIKWSNYFTVTVHYVDQSGNEIGTTTSADNVTIGNGQTITFADKAKAIDGYTYQNARYGSLNGQVVTSVTGKEESGWIIGVIPYTNRYLDFYNGSTRIQEIEDGLSTKTANVYLVYAPNSGGSGGEITPAPEPAHTKKAVKNEDGTYDLSLSVKGTAGSETQPAAVDILMIVDVSGSMSGSRIQNMKAAMNTLVNTVNAKSDIDARFSIVSFAGQNGKASDAKEVLNWTSGNISSSIASLSANGGTNYQAGLKLGKTQLNSARTNAQKIVIFLSDGKPTFYIGGGDGSSTIGNKGWNATQAEAAGMSCDQFYSIGISSSQETYLKGVMNSVNATKKDYKASNSDGSNLTTIFDGIAGSVTEIHCTQVEVHDTLSGMAQMVTLADGTVKNLKVTVTDKDGATVTTPAGITASYNESTKTISMNFPSNYELNPDYTYTVTATIEPSEAAYEAYKNNGGVFPDTPDAGTGTHADANESGFYCNTSATLTYNNGKETKTVSYDKPVIQLEPKVNDLTITKEVTDDNQEDNPDVSNITYSFTITPGSSVTVDDGTYGAATFSNNEGTVTINGRGTANVTGLPLGTYTVTETTPTTDPVGYNFDSTGSRMSGSATLTKDAAGSVTITNNYKLKQLKVTILKDVTGNMGETNREFSFTAGDDSFRLKDKDENTSSKKVITVPYGSNLSITESDYSGDGYTTTYQVGSENAKSGSTCSLTNITEDTTVTFINEKNVNPPTGVTTNVTPYIIMAVLAAGAAVFFVMNRRPQGKRYS